MASTTNDASVTRGQLTAAGRPSDCYGVENWGSDYFFVSEAGNLAVSPLRVPEQSADLFAIVQQLVEERNPTPFLLRFPQILDDRLALIHRAFRAAIKEFEYPERHFGLYPIKVNQKVEVVRRLVEAGRRYDYGLEVGSKGELLVALGMPLSDRALIVCNGMKDSLFLRLALLAEKLGRRVLIVVEDPAEMIEALDLAKKLGVTAKLGVRVKLYSRGSGKWEESGGEFAKFGMSALMLVRTLELLQERGQASALKMLHFHIGSQITDIRRAKRAFKEAARTYAKVRQMGFDVECLNVGGGLGVDYDGSKTSSEFSVNYTVQEFANDVVYTIKEVCESESVPCPKIVNEAGRAMVAHHAMLVTDVKKVIRPGMESNYDLDTMTSDAQPIVELTDIAREINAKNFREYYHDALQDREDLNKLYELGYLNLVDRAKGEWLFWYICRQAVKLSKSAKERGEEFEDLDRLLASKYVCNFSMFQSLPDFWAFDQLFPIMPIHRLGEVPVERGILCDITCDSDGAVDKFVDIRDVKEALELHPMREGEPYYLGILLIGAYQETLGDVHNLFGEVAEVSVTIDKDGEVSTEDLQRGDSVREVLAYMGHETDELRDALDLALSARRESGLISTDDEREVMSAASLVLDDYTYLT
jgi:arginine decarboxylase